MMRMRSRSSRSAQSASKYFLESAQIALREYREGKVEPALRVIEYVEQHSGLQEFNCQKLGMSYEEYMQFLDDYESKIGERLDLQLFRTY